MESAAKETVTESVPSSTADVQRLFLPPERGAVAHERVYVFGFEPENEYENQEQAAPLQELHVRVFQMWLKVVRLDVHAVREVHAAELLRNVPLLQVQADGVRIPVRLQEVRLAAVQRPVRLFKM